MSDIVVGVIGFGTVGKGVVKILLNDREISSSAPDAGGTQTHRGP